VKKKGILQLGEKKENPTRYKKKNQSSNNKKIVKKRKLQVKGESAKRLPLLLGEEKGRRQQGILWEPFFPSENKVFPSLLRGEETIIDAKKKNV